MRICARVDCVVVVVVVVIIVATVGVQFIRYANEEQISK